MANKNILMTKENKLYDIQNALLNVALHLKNYLPIANAHMTDFIAKDWWQMMVLPEIQRDLLQLSELELSLLPSGKIYEENSNTHEDVGIDKSCDLFICGDKDQILSGIKPKWDETLLPSWAQTSVETFIKACQSCSLPHLGILSQVEDIVGENSDSVKISEFMSEKKCHEVEIMAELCASLAKQHKVNTVIDIGSGKGYLGAHLALKHELYVLGIDSSSTNTVGAGSRSETLNKQWDGIVTRTKEGSKKQQRQRKSEDKIAAVMDIPKDMIAKACPETTQEIQRLENQPHLLRDQTLNPIAITDKKFQEPEKEVLSQGQKGIHKVMESPISDIDPRNITGSKTQCGRFIPVTKFVDKSTDIQNLLNCNFHLNATQSEDMINETDLSSTSSRPNLEEITISSVVDCEQISSDHQSEFREHVMDYMISGLHACGDLTPNTLRLFLSNNEARVLCNVGCCYHHLTEAFIRCPYGKGDNLDILECGFPLSQFLRERGCQLGRNARMLAAQAPDRIADSGKVAGECHYWRGLLQVILRDITGELRKDWVVGKIAAKCPDFKTYVNKSLSKLNIAQKLTDDDIQTYQERYSAYEMKIRCFFQLKAALAPCIETLILLDRAIFLLEQECIKDVSLIQAFDPVKSPRCYTLIARK